MGLSYEAILVGGIISVLLTVLAGSFVHIMHYTFRIKNLSLEGSVHYPVDFVIEKMSTPVPTLKPKEATLRDILHEVIANDSEIDRVIKQIESSRQFYRATQKFVKDYRNSIKPYGMAQFILMDTKRFFDNNIPITQTAINQLAYGSPQGLVAIN